MIHIPNPAFRRRSLLAGAAGLIAAPVPVLSEALAQGAGGQTAVIDVSRARTAPIPIAIPDLRRRRPAARRSPASSATTCRTAGCSG